MAYERELRFLLNAFKKSHLQVLLVLPDQLQPEKIDKQLRSALGCPADYERVFHNILSMLRPNTFFKLTDQFFCTYLFLQLPPENERVMIIGPYLSAEMNNEQILEVMESSSISPLLNRYMTDYYATLPLLTNRSPVYDMLEAFAELIWGGETNYSVVDINQEFSSLISPILRSATAMPQNDVLQNMQNMERRYAFENELLQAVSMGLAHKTESLLAMFNDRSYERRLADPVRNLKNSCIIANTLLRKAAEHGGVHPLYLDSMSSGFARRIETITSPESGHMLISEMSRAYCRLVKRHSTLQYSLPVQKTIIYIDSDLSADLSLKALAGLLSINASYLSTLFRRETGQTLTDFVNQRRVRLALHLLSTTKLQIQTIAQHCGISDINYFSKIFKKYTQHTPKEYRKAIMSHPESLSRP